MILTLERVGFDRMVERGRLRQAVFWAVMLFVLQLAFGVFGSNPISELLRGLIAYLPNVFVAILIVVGSVIVAVGDGGIRTIQGASATDLYDAGSGQGSRTLRGR